MDKNYFVYIMTNKNNTTLYTGVTNSLKRRIWEHKESQVDGFTKRYNIDKLVFFEIHTNIKYALRREKQIKAGSRKKKIELVEKENRHWQDLYPKL